MLWNLELGIGRADRWESGPSIRPTVFPRWVFAGRKLSWTPGKMSLCVARGCRGLVPFNLFYMTPVFWDLLKRSEQDSHVDATDWDSVWELKNSRRRQSRDERQVAVCREP